MAPFRWPSIKHDLALATEVAARNPEVPDDWAHIAVELSEAFSIAGKEVKIKGRGCKERIQLLINKYEENDKRALKKYAKAKQSFFCESTWSKQSCTIPLFIDLELKKNILSFNSYYMTYPHTEEI